MRRSLLLFAFLAAILTPRVQAQVDIIIDDGGGKWSPDDLWQKKFPWEKEKILLTPEEKRLYECLESTDEKFFELIQGAVPRISLPHDGVACRIESQTAVLTTSLPESAPSLPAVPAIADLPPDFSGLRKIDRDLLVALTPAHLHLLTMSRQLERLQAAREQAVLLKAKWERIGALVPLDLEKITSSYRFLSSPKCVQTGRAGSLALLIEKYEPLAFLPELQAVMASVNLSSGQIVPAGVDTCERGTVQEVVARTKPVDWTQGCWSRDRADGEPEWSCRERQPAVNAADGIGAGCKDDYEAQFAPFFVAPEVLGRRRGAPEAREAKSTLIFAFPSLLDARNTASEMAETRWRSQYDSDWAAARSAFVTFAAALSVERDRLEAERLRLDTEKQSLVVLAQEIVTLKATVTSAATAEQTAEKARAAAETLLQQLDLQIDAAETSRSKAEQEVAARTATAEGVQLNCGGLNYAQCTDATAKQQFDRLRYEAYQKLATARGRWLQILRQLQQLRMKRSQTALARLGALTDKQSATHEKNRAATAVRRKEEEHATRLARYNADSALYNILRPGLDSDWTRLRQFLADLHLE